MPSPKLTFVLIKSLSEEAGTSQSDLQLPQGQVHIMLTPLGPTDYPFIVLVLLLNKAFVLFCAHSQCQRGQEASGTSWYFPVTVFCLWPALPNIEEYDSLLLNDILLLRIICLLRLEPITNKIFDATTVPQPLLSALCHDSTYQTSQPSTWFRTVL